jgi:Ca2+-binding RTX toxin-like protein
MLGGTGDDAYAVNDAGDVVSEFAGAGADTVRSTLSYALTNVNVENLVLIGNAVINATGNGLANLLSGNNANNLLTGGNGNDTLDGSAGADTMKGWAGDDSYVVDHAGDFIIEGLNSGLDSVASSVTYTLRNNLENLTLTGGNNLNGTGNGLANVLTGNAANNFLTGGVGNDSLDGAAGNDNLKGGLGHDVLTGGSGADNFFFAEAPGAANSDVITDFASGADRLRLDDAFFAAIDALGIFALNDARFFAGAGATGGDDASDRVVYDTGTGNLYYDSDGSGLGAAHARRRSHPRRPGYRGHLRASLTGPP